MSEFVSGGASRVVPELPPVERRMRLLIDTDAGTEIDDLYAIALAVASPERFQIEGFVATHFATKTVGREGPDSIERSVEAVEAVLQAAGQSGRYPITRGAHPMQYFGWPSEGQGVDFIIERAHAGTSSDPLWVVGLGASTNLASAICKDPTISDKVRLVFHCRSAETWPERSVQYNVKGDVTAARTLLESNAPLVWFDTGTQLCRTFEETAATLAPTGRLGSYLHEFRLRKPYYMLPTKGFFDMADIAWMLKPELCKDEVVAAPSMDHYLFFDHQKTHGRMKHVYEIENAGTWDLLCRQLTKHEAAR